MLHGQATRCAVILLLAGAGNLAGCKGPKVPLVSQEEQRVYEAVLDGWRGFDTASLLINERLSPMPSVSGDASCVAGLKFDDVATRRETKSSLRRVKFDLPGVYLVDGDTWKPLDPEAHIGTEGVDAAVKHAIAESLITLSEVHFSADRQDALVEVETLCGRLCGVRFTVRVHKKSTQWRTAEQCSFAIS